MEYVHVFPSHRPNSVNPTSHHSLAIELGESGLSWKQLARAVPYLQARSSFRIPSHVQELSLRAHNGSAKLDEIETFLIGIASRGKAHWGLSLKILEGLMTIMYRFDTARLGLISLT